MVCTKSEKSGKPGAGDSKTANSKDSQVSPKDDGKSAPGITDSVAGSATSPERANPKESNDKSASKRKQNTTTSEPSKKPKTSEQGRRQSRRNKDGVDDTKIINYLLSKDAEEFCRADDEKEDLKKRPGIRTYSSKLNPFEELLCAVVLSKPISHKLGLRTIRTVLNDPYSFNSASAIRNTSDEKRLQSLWDAHTQHKDKTASQLSSLADAVMDKFSDGDDGTSLKKALDDQDGNVEKALNAIKEAVNGLGHTGIEIFLRRVQWLEGWNKRIPYADNKSNVGLKKLGLPTDGEKLYSLLEKNWDELKTDHLDGQGEQKKHRAFVVLLDRATSADLGGDDKSFALLEEAAKYS